LVYRSRAAERIRSIANIVAALQIFFFMLLSPTFAATTGETPTTILEGGSRIDVVVENGGPFDISKPGLLDWVRWAAQAVTAYYGRFPEPHILLRIRPVGGQGIRHGVTYPWGGGLITISVGADTTPADFQSDWELTHEMVHLAFPSVAENHHWIEEGIATYVEPIARVRAHHFDPAEMWYEVVRDLPQGLPAAGDQGLDNTHTWGRTYWGGALFCLLADVEIHRETQNKKGLDDALRGILNAGGNIMVDWDLEKALRVGDQATGVPVLENLYDKMKDKPYTPDLDALWKELGIERNGTTVRFDDSAPLAATRKAITYGENTPQ